MNEQEYTPNFNELPPDWNSLPGHIEPEEESIPEFTRIKFKGETYLVKTDYYLKSKEEGKDCVYLTLDKEIEFITREEMNNRALLQNFKPTRAQRRALMRKKK